jgi:hypothetical protein
LLAGRPDYNAILPENGLKGNVLPASSLLDSYKTGMM